MATSTRTAVNVGKIFNNLIRARIAAYQEVAQGITIKKQKVTDLMKEKYGLASNTQLGQKLRVLKEYWKVEMSPPGPSEMEKLKLDSLVALQFLNSGAWKEMTVKQAWLLFLVALEVGLWFFLGETVGKFHLVGYKV